MLMLLLRLSNIKHTEDNKSFLSYFYCRKGSESFPPLFLPCKIKQFSDKNFVHFPPSTYSSTASLNCLFIHRTTTTSCNKQQPIYHGFQPVKWLTRVVRYLLETIMYVLLKRQKERKRGKEWSKLTKIHYFYFKSKTQASNIGRKQKHQIYIMLFHNCGSLQNTSSQTCVCDSRLFNLSVCRVISSTFYQVFERVSTAYHVR